jgi:glycosyltransferase involved in cell wall biosynthesis
MFWGRLAALRADVPVVLSALHSTGWPTHVEWPNRCLAPWTDGFIAVAENHSEYIAEHEGCPRNKIHVIPNGVDTETFCPQPRDPARQAELGLPHDAPVIGVVAEMRPEKNLELWLKTAAEVRRQLPRSRFMIVGDGQQRQYLESLSVQLGLADAVIFCGRRRDVAQLLPLMDVFMLTSDMEAKPVSILEAMASGVPVLTTNVGSNSETIEDGVTGYLVPAGDRDGLAQRASQLLTRPAVARAMGSAARCEIIANHSVARMVEGYEQLIEQIYEQKCPGTLLHPADSPSDGRRARWPIRREASVALAERRVRY